jgi:hypothetical protein
MLRGPRTVSDRQNGQPLQIPVIVPRRPSKVASAATGFMAPALAPLSPSL